MFIPWRRTKKKKLAGQVAKQEWYHQFLDKDTDIKRLANKINSYFVGLTDHFPPLCQGVPRYLFLMNYEFQSMRHTSPCPRFRHRKQSALTTYLTPDSEIFFLGVNPMTWSGTAMLMTLLRKLLRSYTPLEFSAEPGWANPTSWGCTFPQSGQF